MLMIEGLFLWRPSECRQTAGSQRFKLTRSPPRWNSNSSNHHWLKLKLGPHWRRVFQTRVSIVHCPCRVKIKMTKTYPGSRSSFRRRHCVAGAELVAPRKVTTFRQITFNHHCEYLLGGFLLRLTLMQQECVPLFISRLVCNLLGAWSSKNYWSQIVFIIIVFLMWYVQLKHSGNTNVLGVLGSLRVQKTC